MTKGVFTSKIYNKKILLIQLLDLNTYIGGNLELKSKLKTIHNRILNSLQTELFFYQKLKELSFNI